MNLFFSSIVKTKNTRMRNGVDLVDGWDFSIHEIWQPSDIVLYPAFKKDKNGIKIYIDQEKKSAEIN